MWSLKAFKAPNPDGLHAGFFQRFWATVGASVKVEMKNIFSTRKVPDYLNKTLITHILKIQGLETLGNYCLISLCNTVYKVVTKIIVNWIRPLLGSLISLMQVAFVLRRRGIDNAIIVQQLVQSISKAKGKK